MDINDSSSSAASAASSDISDFTSEFEEKIRNISGTLQDKFPSVKISDIPGLETDGTLGTSANFLLFMMSLVFGMVWITYITFFNSRLVARFVTKIANRFVGGNGGYFKVGSLSWAVLPGKIMFRDVCYVTADYTVRIQDGYVVFRWWRRYVPKYDVADTATTATGTGGGNGGNDGHSTSSGHAKDNTRVSVQLNGLELHTYNRTSVYREAIQQLEISIINFLGAFLWILFERSSYGYTQYDQ